MVRIPQLYMFVPVRLKHGEHMDRKLLTHVRLRRRRADTSKAQRCLDHIQSLCDKEGVVSISNLLPGWPPERLSLGPERDMWHCLRHYANSVTSGTQTQNKGLIEVGYLKADSAEQTLTQPGHIEPRYIASLLEGASGIRGGGESEAHRLLKISVASHPDWFGVYWPHTVSIEYPLPSGDVIDVAFLSERSIVAVEVKPPDAPKADLTRGVFQCVKYAAVLQAEAKVRKITRDSRVILAVGSIIPTDILSMLQELKIERIENLSLK